MKTGEIKLMISHGKDIKIFSGNSNPELAKAICKELGLPLGDSECGNFSDGETFVSIYETVRGSDVFLINSTCKPVNDSLMELLIMIDACRRASAGRITAVIPYFGYARQDRKAKSRDPISAKLVANMIVAAGADRVLTMDLHASQIQGFFDIPVDNLYGAPLFATHYLRRFGYGREDMVVVSPDVGSVARARSFAMKMGLGLAIVDKRREKANSNICSNQSLMALYVTIYLSLMGKKGLRQVCDLSYGAAHYLHDRLIETGLFSEAFNRPFLKEFALHTDIPADRLQQALLDGGFFGALPTEEGLVTFCATERRTREEIDRMIDLIKQIQL